MQAMMKHKRDRTDSSRGHRAGLRPIAVALAGLALVAGLPKPAEAQRPDLRRMSCAQAQSLVARHGAIVMTTGRHTYQRFVAGPRFCDHWEVVRPEVQQTRDAPRCLVGYICETPLFSPFERD